MSDEEEDETFVDALETVDQQHNHTTGGRSTNISLQVQDQKNGGDPAMLITYQSTTGTDGQKKKHVTNENIDIQYSMDCQQKSTTEKLTVKINMQDGGGSCQQKPCQQAVRNNGSHRKHVETQTDISIYEEDNAVPRSEIIPVDRPYINTQRTNADGQRNGARQQDPPRIREEDARPHTWTDRRWRQDPPSYSEQDARPGTWTAPDQQQYPNTPPMNAYDQQHGARRQGPPRIREQDARPHTGTAPDQQQYTNTPQMNAYDQQHGARQQVHEDQYHAMVWGDANGKWNSPSTQLATTSPHRATSPDASMSWQGHNPVYQNYWYNPQLAYNGIAFGYPDPYANGRFPYSRRMSDVNAGETPLKTLL